MADSIEHDNEFLNSIKGGKFLEQALAVKKNSNPLRYLGSLLTHYFLYCGYIQIKRQVTTRTKYDSCSYRPEFAAGCVLKFSSFRH
jgi:hypothetical protein